MKVYVVGDRVFTNERTAKINNIIQELYDGLGGGYGTGPGVKETTVENISPEEMERCLVKHLTLLLDLKKIKKLLQHE